MINDVPVMVDASHCIRRYVDSGLTWRAVGATLGVRNEITHCSNSESEVGVGKGHIYIYIYMSLYEKLKCTMRTCAGISLLCQAP